MFCPGTESTTVQSPCKSTLVMILQMLFNTRMLYLSFAISYFFKLLSRNNTALKYVCQGVNYSQKFCSK